MEETIDIISIESDRLLEDTLFFRLLQFVSIEKKERILKFRFKKDAEHCLLADLLARFLIMRRTGLVMEKIEFCYNQYKKPYIKQKEPYFNTSHSGNMILGAIGSREIGIDIEEMKEIDLDIAKRFFCQEEFEYIVSAGTNKLQLFFEIWTKKESYIKAVGKGLSLPLNSFNVLDEVIMNNGSRYCTKSLHIISGYAAALCTPKVDLDINIINLSANQFICLFLPEI